MKRMQTVHQCFSIPASHRMRRGSYILQQGESQFGPPNPGRGASQAELPSSMHSSSPPAQRYMQWRPHGVRSHDKQRAPCSGISTMTLYDTAAGGALGPSAPPSK